MKLLKAGKIITLVSMIFCIIGTVLCLTMTVMAFVNPQWLVENGTLTVNGIEITQPLELLENPTLAFAIVFLTGTIGCFFAAVVFQRMHSIIVETLAGRPFQPCTIKWMRQIGWCAILLPLLGSIMSLIAQLINADGIHATLDPTGILMGVLVLCLTHVFAYGLELQKDVDELL